MSDATDVAATGGYASAIVAIVIALADYIRKRNAAALEKKLEKTAPSEFIELPHMKNRDVTFDRPKEVYSAELLARVESYVRAEGDLRIQIAQKDWQYKELVTERDNLLRALHQSGEKISDLEGKNHALKEELLNLRKSLRR
jgi:hypothetical protein